MALPEPTDFLSQDAPGVASSLDEVKRMRKHLSLKLIRSFDDRVENIIFQTPFVTAYELNNREQWERAEIEGFLYVLTRHGEPMHSFVLVNRKSENHLIEYITPEFQMTIEGNFIFYHSINIKTNLMNNIRGLWFFDEKECQKTFERISAILINTRPLSGFNRSDGKYYSGNYAFATCVRMDDPGSTIHVPAPSPDVRLQPKQVAPNRKEGIMNPLMAALQQNSKPVQANTRTPDFLLEPKLRSTYQPEIPKPKNATPDVLSALFPHFKHRENRTCTTRQAPQNPVTSQPPATQNASQETEPPKPTEQSITVTREMLSKAFNEAILSEEFVSLLWNKMRGLSSRKNG